jgi:hypothetical protein
MIRLERADFQNPETLQRLAAAAKLAPEQFQAEFAPVWQREAAPTS